MLRALFAALLLTSACTITLPVQATPVPAATSYATVEAALRVLVEHHVSKPDSKLLLGGAAQDVGAHLKGRGTPAEVEPPTFSGKTEDDLRAFGSYLDQVLQRTPSVAKTELERVAVNGMAKSTDECHTYYLEPDRARTFNQPSREQYSGIGARIQQSAPNTTTLPEVTQVFNNSPAERAGVRMGDRIKKVDDREVAGLTAEEVANMIRGPAGSAVLIVLVRGATERVVTITRASLVVPDIVEQMVGEGAFGHIQVSNITASIPRDLADTLGRLDAEGARGWILDLRSDPGGLLEPAEQVASTFIRSGNVIYEVGRDGNPLPKPVNPKAFYRNQKPLAVLVNRYSASGAEIVASAVQEHGVGRIFGEPTAGCISIALPRELPDGGLLLYTYANIQSAVNREDLSGKGVTPDEVVTRLPDESGDKVLDAAIAWLRTQARP